MKQRGDTEEPTRPFRSGPLLGALGVILTFLACIEIRALYVDAGPDEFWSDLAVPSATAVVFLAPVPGAIYVGLRAEGVATRRAADFAAAWMAVFSVLLCSSSSRSRSFSFGLEVTAGQGRMRSRATRSQRRPSTGACRSRSPRTRSADPG